MTKNRGIRLRIYHLIDNDEEQSFGSQTFEIFITALILLSIVTIVLESFVDHDAQLRTVYGIYFDTFENITLTIFCIEYLLRILTADYKYKDLDNWSPAAWRFICSGNGIIDLVALSPILFHFISFLGLTHFGKADFRFIRILKITRLLRIFKMNAFNNSIMAVAGVFKEKRHDLGITLFVTFILLMVSATIMYYVEGPAQPDLFPNILSSFWWAIATLTTVGYGDVFPITPLGKFLSGIIALLGIGLVALPAGILSSAFIEKLEDGTIKEEDVDDFVSKTVLPQAQFQKITSKKHSAEEDHTIKMKYPIISDNHEDCKNHFGQSFIYCPYCGTKLSDEDDHEHS